MAANPNNGPAHGRFRKTLSEEFRQAQRADPFPLGPGDTNAFGQQKRDLFFQNNVALASLKAQAQMIRAQYRQAKRGAVASGRSAMADVQGNMAERGIIGSTVNQVEREGVRGNVQGAIGEAFMAKQGGLLGVNQSRLEALAQLRLGLSDLALQKSAAQKQMALAAFGSGGQNPWGY